MPNDISEFSLPAGAGIAGLAGQLQSGHRLVEEPVRKITKTYYDSFDWRLYQADVALEAESRQEGVSLIWARLGNGDEEERQVLEQVPRFAWEFPVSRLRNRVEPVLQMRALLPQVRVESRVRMMRLLNEDEKTVLRLSVESSDYRAPQGREKGALGDRVRLVPVKGYGSYRDRVAEILQTGMDLEPSERPLMVDALTALGRSPGDYSSKLDFRLDPQLRCDAVAKQIQLHLLDTLEANVPGTRADLDSEFLHDLRVATRRTRSALTQIRGVFPAEQVERFKADFGWIGQVTGPTRDMDVYLLGFAGYRDSLPEAFRADLEPLHEFLLAHHQSEQKALARKLASPHFRKMLKDWRAFLEAPLEASPSAPNALRPMRELADARIFKTYKRVLKEGLAIGPETPAEALHELRKSCKKLRYLMEFFQSLYNKKEIRPLIRVLKVLLDNLGIFNDLEVQAGKLRQFARQMMEEGSAPAETLLAMGMLVNDLLRRQFQVRDEFADRFAVFVLAENRKAFKALFGARSAMGGQS